jgi:hypothetical protein
VKLKVKDGELEASPPGALGPELRQEIRANKAAILVLLTDHLTPWLAEPYPRATEGLEGSVRPFHEYHALAAALDAYAEEGELAAMHYPYEQPEEAEALRRVARARREVEVLEELIRALRGKPFDRDLIGLWLVQELTAAGDTESASVVSASLAGGDRATEYPL